jgi:hypothetical protein
MGMKGALTASQKAVGSKQEAGNPVKGNLTEHFYCGLRKSEPRISVAVCHQKRCLFLESDGGKFRCNYRNYLDPKRGGRKDQ